jgi:FMN-dependent NADH-azoreductase
MTRILNVQSSPYLEKSASRSVSKSYLDRYIAAQPDTVIVDLDLVANPPAHLGPHHMTGLFKPPPHSPESAAAREISEAYLKQVFDADVLLVATPMHNFAVSSTVKAWIDYIVIAGRTFRIDERGQAFGLIPSDKKLVIVVASGGVYPAAGPAWAPDRATSSYIEDVFNFMGVTDVSIIRAEGQIMGSVTAEKELAEARAKARALADRHSVLGMATEASLATKADYASM